jgi:UDP-N-acetylglucosamine:LPS N-acetylglucosamine transferase
LGPGTAIAEELMARNGKYFVLISDKVIDSVTEMGGYPNFPRITAGFWMRKKIVLNESNQVIGLIGK